MEQVTIRVNGRPTSVPRGTTVACGHCRGRRGGISHCRSRARRAVRCAAWASAANVASRLTACIISDRASSRAGRAWRW